MATLNKTNFANAMKVKYGSKLEKYWYDEACPAAKLIKKQGGLGGSTHNFAAAITGSNGAVVFSTAQTGASTPTFEQRAITPTKEYHVGKIDNLAIALSQGGGAFEGAVEAQMGSCMQGYSTAVSHQIWGNGGGARGRVSAISSATITLSERADAVNFWEGLVLELSADDGLGGGGVRSGTVTVDSVDVDAGTVICTGNVTAGIAAAATNDYIFREDDYNAVMKGILAWIPVSAPTGGDSFFGVDRSSHVNRMAGSRVTATGSAMEKAIFDACGSAELVGGKPDTLFLNPLKYADLVDSLDSRAFTQVGGEGKLGVSGIKVAGPSGSIDVVSDRNCPKAYGMLTKLSDWELLYAGKGCPHFEETQGKMRVIEADDALEFRLKAYWQTRTKQPKNSVLITWG